MKALLFKYANWQIGKLANWQIGKWAKGQVGKYANWQMGKWQICKLANGQVSSWQSAVGRFCSPVFLPHRHNREFHIAHRESYAFLEHIAVPMVSKVVVRTALITNTPITNNQYPNNQSAVGRFCSPVFLPHRHNREFHIAHRESYAFLEHIAVPMVSKVVAKTVPITNNQYTNHRSTTRSWHGCSPVFLPHRHNREFQIAHRESYAFLEHIAVPMVSKVVVRTVLITNTPITNTPITNTPITNTPITNNQYTNTPITKSSNLQILKSTLLLLISLLSLKTTAQQTPLATLYRDQWSILNPGAISSNYLLNDRTMTLSASWREQWWNVPGSPSTQSVNWEWVQDDYNSVWGAHLLNDRTGKIGQTGIFARYAYRIRLGRRVDQSVTIGIQGGFVQYRARISDIRFPDPFTQPIGNEVIYRPDVGMGIFYHYKNRYYAGLSVPQTFGFETKFAENPLLSIRRVPHLYAVLGTYLDATWIGNETSFIEPSLWVKYVPGAPVNMDVNARAQISELVWAGTGFNIGIGQELGLALHLEAGLFFGEQSGLNFGQFKAGFGLDVPLRHDLVSNFGAAAEINLVYSWE